MAFIIQAAHLIVKVIFDMDNALGCLDIEFSGFGQLQLSLGTDKKGNADFLLQSRKILA